MAYKTSIQMVAAQSKCCVTWLRMVEVEPFFRDVWTALLAWMVIPQKWLWKFEQRVLAWKRHVMFRNDLEDFKGNIKYTEDETFRVADKAEKSRPFILGYNYDTSGDSMRNGKIETDFWLEGWKLWNNFLSFKFTICCNRCFSYN